jgi:hypothetical protein
MLEYQLGPIVPKSIDGRKARGKILTPAIRSGYCVESHAAQSLKEDGFVICGLTVTQQPEDFEEMAHSLFEICSSEKLFPVLLAAEYLMAWKRHGFTAEWYSQDSPNADAWLDDLRDAWGMDVVADLPLFIEIHGGTIFRDGYFLQDPESHTAGTTC